MPPIDVARLDTVFPLMIEPRKPMALLRGWKRLDGRPRVTDFERSLRAEVRDPLWFLTRQWQFGEFQGEDAASPIDVKLGIRSAPLAALRIGAADAPYDPAVPVETRVEREAIPFDLTLHMQASRYAARVLTRHGVGLLLAKFVTQWPLGPTSVSGESHADAARVLAAGAPFLFDAAALLAAIRGGTFPAAAAAMTGNATEQTALIAAAADILAWFDRTYGEPRAEPSAWRADRLSYQFQCATAAGPAATLVATSAQGGMLDRTHSTWRHPQRGWSGARR